MRKISGLTENQRLMVIDLYSGGMSMLEISDRCKINYHDIRKVLIDNRIEIRECGRGQNKALSDEEWDEAKSMYLAGYTAPMICEKFNISRKRFEKYLSKYGIRKRDRGVKQ